MMLTKGGELLRVARARLRLTQAEAGAEVGISARTVVALELGQTVPRLEAAYRMCERFEIPMDAWLQPAEPVKGGAA